jgi:16S rRNA (guanine966-N2)-methyltransferase
MRIVGGEFRGRVLTAPRSDRIRPTTDRTRESLFNILEHGHGDRIAGARVLDLFAGTGALGCEAASRGARAVCFVEQSAEARAIIQRNIETLGLQGRARILRRDATSLGPAQRIEPFDVVFADPPYGRGLGERALRSAAGGGWIRLGALVILEERSHVAPELPDTFFSYESRAFGDTTIHFYAYGSVRNEG